MSGSIKINEDKEKVQEKLVVINRKIAILLSRGSIVEKPHRIRWGFSTKKYL